MAVVWVADMAALAATVVDMITASTTVSVAAMAVLEADTAALVADMVAWVVMAAVVTGVWLAVLADVDLTVVAVLSGVLVVDLDEEAK